MMQVMCCGYGAAFRSLQDIFPPPQTKFSGSAPIVQSKFRDVMLLTPIQELGQRPGH